MPKEKLIIADKITRETFLDEKAREDKHFWVKSDGELVERTGKTEQDRESFLESEAAEGRFYWSKEDGTLVQRQGLDS